MTPSPKTLALRYRIWAFAKGREWNVTINEIAEALDASAQRVGATLQGAGWLNRVRTEQTRVGSIRMHKGARLLMGGSLVEDSRPIIRDVLAGRVNSEFTA